MHTTPSKTKGQIEPDIRFTHQAIYASDEVYAKQRHIRDNVGGVVRTLKAKLASPARRRGGYDLLESRATPPLPPARRRIKRRDPALDRGNHIPRIGTEMQVHRHQHHDVVNDRRIGVDALGQTFQNGSRVGSS